MKLEIYSDWLTCDSVGNPIFTLRLKKENGERYYCAHHSECFSSEYQTYQSLMAAFMEILHVAYPECVKQEIEEIKKMTREINK